MEICCDQRVSWPQEMTLTLLEPAIFSCLPPDAIRRIAPLVEACFRDDHNIVLLVLT